MNEKVLEFTIFCIDNLAEHLKKDTNQVKFLMIDVLGLIYNDKKYRSV